MRNSLIAALMVLAANGAQAADPVEGLWQTLPDDNGKYGYVQIAPCGDKLCGVLIQSFNGDGSTFASPNIGKDIVWDMVADGGGTYSGGKVWAPDRDKTYSSKMALSGDKLSVSGCVMGFLCRSSEWTRVK